MGMLYRQFVSDPRIYSCPFAPITTIPKLKTIKSWPESGPILPNLSPQQTSYAYDPGHSEKTGAFIVILADKADARGNSDNHGMNLGQNVGYGISVEFRETVQNPLDERSTRRDPNIIARNAELPRDEDSVLRE